MRDGFGVDAAYRRRVLVFHVLIVLLFPIALFVGAVAWMSEGLNLRECYWRCRPAPKEGLRPLSEEEKWPYVRTMEQRIEELEALLETTDTLVRRKISEAMGLVDFGEILRTGIVEAVELEMLKMRKAAWPLLRERAGTSGLVDETSSDVEARYEQEARVVVTEPDVSPAAVGDAVAEAVRRHAEKVTGPLDPELEAAILRLRGGGGDTE